ncbi:MAG: hypothetical protein A3G87_07190 [Omnitrophica bacterium RIFCSPLOWO2_12_FULL_50_11]|nr:MAG: hypothetical protein A3G87_07190 [Omnitrophica bacterium RIFCSPLOWO2_12_FULL_50_11]
MYIRTVKNNSGQAYYQLVESFRYNGQVRKRVLLTLGRIEDHKIEDLAGAISRHRKQLTACDLAKQVSVDETFILGPLLVLEHLFEKLGIRTVMNHIQDQHPRLGFNLMTQLFALVASRFVRSSSKLKVYDHWIEKFYPEMIKDKIEVHTLYRTMDLLAAHKEEIEKKLYRHGRDLLNMPVDVVLYDLTTLRFESTRTDLGRLRQFGYSKEMRTDCTQVVFGLLVDTDGIPLGFEVYPGNTFEGETLKDIVEKMRAKFEVRRFIFVGDRGIFSKKNLDLLSQDGTEFIVGMKLGVVRKRHEEFYDLNRFRPINESLYVYETEYEGDRLIVTWSRARYERDQKARGDILEKILKKLGSKKVKAETFISNRSYRRFVRLDGKSKPVLNEEAIQEDEKKDGFFGVVTSVKDLKADEIVMHYKDLWKIEDAFGEFKGSTLKTRPVFHWKDRRIVGHLTLCFLAYLCEAHMTKVLRQKAKRLTSKSIEDGIIKERPLTVSEIMKELCEVRVVPVRFGAEKTLWVRTDINGNAAQLFTAIGMRLPPKVLKET